MIEVRINSGGYREVLGMMVGDTESESSWGEFFSRLKDIGLHGVDIITSYDHRGLVRAIRHYFCGVTWQRCHTKQPKGRSTLTCTGYLKKRQMKKQPGCFLVGQRRFMKTKHLRP